MDLFYEVLEMPTPRDVSGDKTLSAGYGLARADAAKIVALAIFEVSHPITAAIHRLTELGELDHAKALADALAKLEGR